mmetsp:Transcript_41737/g.73397  ORF Transcript_41737/g.73397 Transcript_41737/m.73397 type:complete len:265 (+) Transcript_41737:18-812(+)
MEKKHLKRVRTQDGGSVVDRKDASRANTFRHLRLHLIAIWSRELHHLACTVALRNPHLHLATSLRLHGHCCRHGHLWSACGTISRQQDLSSALLSPFLCDVRAEATKDENASNNARYPYQRPHYHPHDSSHAETTSRRWKTRDTACDGSNAVSEARTNARYAVGGYFQRTEAKTECQPHESKANKAQDPRQHIGLAGQLAEQLILAPRAHAQVRKREAGTKPRRGGHPVLNAACIVISKHCDAQLIRIVAHEGDPQVTDPWTRW